MITAAMLLLVSDWLVIAGNHGLGGGGGGHLQERRLTDKPEPNWPRETGPEDSKNESSALLLGKPEEDLHRGHATNISHGEFQTENDKTMEADDKSLPLQRKKSGATFGSIEGNITRKYAMLKPLFRVYLDTRVKNADAANTSVTPDKASKFSQQSSANVAQHAPWYKSAANSDGYMSDQTDAMLNPSFTDKNDSDPNSSNTSAMPRYPRGSLGQSPFKVPINVSQTMVEAVVSTDGAALRKGSVCGAYMRRCQNGKCVSEAMSCPQTACPFRCQNKWQCVSVFKRCDGERDCEDGSDEKGCGRLRHSSSYRRVVVVATVIIVVIGVSLFCCVLIHVYRSAQNSDRRNASGVGPEANSDNNNSPSTEYRPTPGWSALYHLRRFLPHLRPFNATHGPHAGPSSASFQSMSSGVTQPFLQQHDQQRHTQSETLQSFLSASESSSAVTGAAEGGEGQQRRWTVEAAGPPPPYDEVVSLGPVPPESPSRVTLFHERGPPPTYESIFCIEV